MSQLTLLLIEDDLGIREYLTLGLHYEGFHVLVAETASQGLGLLAQQPDLILLDINLPGSDGFTFLKQLRAFNQTPVLVVTARDHVDDRLIGLHSGADDYIIKPFIFAELVARIRAVLRRVRPEIQDTLSYADVVMHTATRELYRAGQMLEVRPRAFDVLLFFLRYPERLLSKEVVLRSVWGEKPLLEDNLVEVHVSQLRRTLGEPVLLHTVRGSGYILKVRP
jgi:two-component system, OmpR family, response regulator